MCTTVPSFKHRFLTVPLESLENPKQCDEFVLGPPFSLLLGSWQELRVEGGELQ
jgi:hypothetical protein